MGSEAVSISEQSRNRRNRSTIKAYPHFLSFLRGTLGFSLLKAYNVRTENMDLLERIPPPYVLLPNHQMTWDPFILNTLIKDPVFFVTSDIQFRNKFVAFLLKFVGAIPKSKFISDFETIRLIMAAKKQNGIIGIFPEGRRTWDGHTNKLIYSTAKLVKLLKLPVIVPILKGGYLSLPRWSKYRRRGSMIFSFKQGLSVEEVTSMTTDQVFNRLEELIEWDETEYQRKEMIVFDHPKRAQFLELALFVCPSCKSIASLKSKGTELQCSVCNHSVTYNKYGFIEEKGERRIGLDSVRAWNLWQMEYFSSLLLEKKTAKSSEPIMSDKRIWLNVGYRARPLKKFRFGNMVLYYDRIEFRTMKGDILTFPIDEIEGTNVQIKEKVEFYYDNILYHCNFLSRRVSGYKWMNAISILQGNGYIA